MNGCAVYCSFAPIKTSIGRVVDLPKCSRMSFYSKAPCKSNRLPSYLRKKFAWQDISKVAQSGHTEGKYCVFNFKPIVICKIQQK